MVVTLVPATPEFLPVVIFATLDDGTVITLVPDTDYPITWDNEEIKDAAFTHSTVSDPEEITVNESGLYEITVQVSSCQEIITT